MGRPRVGLTGKQEAFIAEYLANGQNGVQAALQAYDTDDPNTAGMIASDNLTKPRIKQAIALALERNDLTVDHSLVAIKDALVATDRIGRPDHGSRLSAANINLRLHQAFEPQGESGGNRGENRHTHLHLELSSIPPEVARWVSAFFRSEGRKPGVQDFLSTWSRPPSSKESRLLAPQPVVVEAEKVGIKAGCRTGKQKVKRSNSKG